MISVYNWNGFMSVTQNSNSINSGMKNESFDCYQRYEPFEETKFCCIYDQIFDGLFICI